MVLEVVSGPFGVVGVEETKCIGAVRGSLKSWSLRHGGFPGSYEAASSEPVRKENSLNSEFDRPEFIYSYKSLLNLHFAL